ncbi:MAG: hypothetical protein E7381_05505 [Clostridiales bacterium]|nr:hypothetical protein [Clostridiales bacterium]
MSEKIYISGCIRVGKATDFKNGKPITSSPTNPSTTVVPPKTEKKIIRADTNAEFLNKRFGTHYKQWYKSTWQESPNRIVWMVRFYGETGGWINRFTDETHNRIVEKYVGKKPIELPPYSHRIRIVVAIEERDVPRRYTIEGVYQFDAKASTLTRRYYNKISDF